MQRIDITLLAHCITKKKIQAHLVCTKTGLCAVLCSEFYLLNLYPKWKCRITYLSIEGKNDSCLNNVNFFIHETGDQRKGELVNKENSNEEKEMKKKMPSYHAKKSNYLRQLPWIAIIHSKVYCKLFFYMPWGRWFLEEFSMF